MSDIEKAKEHIKNLANDYKCYDNTISFEEALALNEALQNPCKICDYFADDIISYCRKSEKPRLQNQDLRTLAKSKNVRMWQIADYLNVSEMWVSRKLRHELDKTEKEKFISIINKIVESR